MLGSDKLRMKLEPRVRCVQELRMKFEARAEPGIEWGRGMGRGFGEFLPRNFVKIHTYNHAIWCILYR